MRRSEVLELIEGHLMMQKMYERTNKDTSEFLLTALERIGMCPVAFTETGDELKSMMWAPENIPLCPNHIATLQLGESSTLDSVNCVKCKEEDDDDRYCGAV